MKHDVLTRFLIWRLKHISNKDFVLILSVVIGVIAGIAAVVLKETVHFIKDLLTGGFDIAYSNYLYLSYPLIGIFLTVLVAYFILKDPPGHGVTNILYYISKGSSLVPRVKMYSRMITSALTVGFGGSVGLEAPIVVTGSAIGSNVARTMHLNYKKRTVLIGCGAAGAIAAIFNSPIAGVIFSIEVILAEVSIAAFIPLLIASVSGSLISMVLLGDDVMFSFQLKDPFTASDVPYFILLGIGCGITSLYFTRVMYRVEAAIGKVKNKYKKVLIGGIGLGLIVFLFPPIYGEGYEAIRSLIEGKESQLFYGSLFFPEYDVDLVLLLFLMGLILIKPVASALTIGSGGSGGVFAPSLFLGGVFGYFFARGVNLFITNPISPANFTLVGMCGIMSGVLHAPLTAIFLIAEITSGYTLFVPLMLVSAISFSTISYFEKYSIYTKKLVEKGDLITDDKDKQLLSLINISKIIETDLLKVGVEANLGDLVNVVRLSKRNIFPVVNDHGELKGIITLDDIRDIMFDEEARSRIMLKDIMHQPPAFVSSHESMESVMKKFENTEAWNLPVIDNGKYIGFVSKSRIFNTYRKKLIRQHRE
jgi:chloride channel protein, CIC family